MSTENETEALEARLKRGRELHANDTRYDRSKITT
jgi:hypothetical protein